MRVLAFRKRLISFYVERSDIVTPVIEAFSIIDQNNENTDNEVIVKTESKAVCAGGNYCSDIC